MESDGRSCSSCVEGAAIENKLGGVPFITGLVSNPIFFLIIISFLDLISFLIYCLSFSPFFKPRFLSYFKSCLLSFAIFSQLPTLPSSPILIISTYLLHRYCYLSFFLSLHFPSIPLPYLLFGVRLFLRLQQHSWQDVVHIH